MRPERSHSILCSRSRGLLVYIKRRDHFLALDKPEEATASEVYHFYQAASLHRHYILRELLPKHELVVLMGKRE
ncbi:MAG: hypothetical protein Q7J15_08465 [Candidatus Desulfaltia sp.]|nr:hypothetical protein [Candidatus Desulfaltia sp.]